MTCHEFTDFIADHLSGELPAGVRLRFEQHLGSCHNCRQYLAGYQATVELGKGAFADADAAVPPEVPDDLVKAILAARPRSSDR